ncbi:MAG: ABC transporter substrate-binding protein [Caldilineae bacterium]|nr:MAG: ABC transporter substrate-binding protein [Caldilineae bacterium]
MSGKRLLSIGLMLALVLIVSACVAPAPAPAPAAPEAPAAPAAPETMRVWITWGDNPAQLQELFNRYGEANNVQIQVNAPVDDEKVIAALSGSNPPDILVLSGPDNVPAWVGEGLLTPLDDIIAANNIDVEDIYPAMLAQGRLHDTQWALPWGSDTYALYWNKDLFEEAGLDPEKPPQTLEELVEYADKLTKVEADGTITQIGFVPDFSWSHIEQYVPMFGGYWISEDGTKVQVDSQPVLDALLWEQQFYTKYGPEEVLRFVASTGDYASAEHGFMAGKVAMMVDGEWMVGPNFIGGLAPDLWYGVAPFPYPADHPERAHTNTVGGTVVVIPSGVANPEASGKLLAWMMSPEIVADEMVANFNLPSSRKAAEDPRFRENEMFAVFMDLAMDPNATSQVFTPASTEINDELALVEEQVLHAGADPAPLLKEAQAKLQPILDKALGK